MDQAGWSKSQVHPSSNDHPFYRIEEWETQNGPADYALASPAHVLAVVEAKKLSLGPQNVLTQAERYAKGATQNPFNFDGYRVPFLYATNGEVTWFHDVRHAQNRSRPVATFHTPGALSDFLSRDFGAELNRLQQLPPDPTYLRAYQMEAVDAVEAALADRKRAMLVAMATGTGKTRWAVNQTYRLLKSGAARRVLFLVDRRALAAQAVRSFRSYEPEPGLKFHQIYELFSQRFQQEDFGEDERFDPSVLPERYLTDPQPGTTFIYVCTIQRMARYVLGAQAAIGPDDETPDPEAPDRLDIPIHAFDTVIADECHRGYTSQEVSVWRQTLDHFDAVKIGLTATPAAHTTSYFSEVVFRYPYERAVREGYLVDYDAVKVSSEVRLQGVFLREGERVGLIDPESGAQALDQMEDERQFEPSEIERVVSSPDSNRRIIEEIKRYALEHEDRYGRFPKTLIFAANDVPHTSHADQLVRLCRDVFGRGESFVQKITGRVDRPLQRIREFRNRPEPHIVVSVDLMSTGVDIPDIEYLVFLRSIQSRILFEQMMGRGTRLGERFPDKSHFVVFDCFGGTLLERFKDATGITAEPPAKPTRPISEVIEDIWQNRDRDYNIRCLTKRLHRIDKEMSGEARDLFAAFIPDGDLARYAKSLPKQLASDFSQTMKLLRDEAFQNLLVTYPRPPKRFFIAEESQDNVSSEWLIRAGIGEEYRPEDYLTAFTRFIRENPGHVEAIRILLDRPRDWSTAALQELHEKLAVVPERFTLDRLEKAHRLTYHKALVDIISMVKHAAEDTSPLLTAPERVEAAIRSVTAGKSLTPPQHKWLARIREYLSVNLALDREAFDLNPVFADHGGWRRADRDFDGKLDELICEINAAVAA